LREEKSVMDIEKYSFVPEAGILLVWVRNFVVE